MVHVWAFPTSGAAATFLGSAPYGAMRSDVGAAFGNARFAPSGFNLTAQLPAGTYDIAAFPYSTLTGRSRRLLSPALPSHRRVIRPRMWVDTPAQNEITSTRIRVTGWALDFGSAINSGVNAVHVWAYPTNGARPILVGTGDYGIRTPGCR